MPLILVDAGLVGLACATDPANPAAPAEGVDLLAWIASTTGRVHQFAVADVTRFEVRRDLIRKRATTKPRRYDELVAGMIAVEVTTEVWDQAAELWAATRRRGRPTAPDDALDGDCILAAVAALLADAGETVIVATTNVRHLAALGADARDWRDIPG